MGCLKWSLSLRLLLLLLDIFSACSYSRSFLSLLVRLFTVFTFSLVSRLRRYFTHPYVLTVLIILHVPSPYPSFYFTIFDFPGVSSRSADDETHVRHARDRNHARQEPHSFSDCLTLDIFPIVSVLPFIFTSGFPLSSSSSLSLYHFRW